MSHHILIVDDEPDLAAMIADLLADAGYATRTAGDGRAALSEVQADPPDLLLLDVRLGDTDGPTLYARLCERWGSAPPVILVTAERDDALRALALERGWGFLAKPVTPAALRALMTQLHVRRAR